MLRKSSRCLCLVHWKCSTLSPLYFCIRCRRLKERSSITSSLDTLKMISIACIGNQIFWRKHSACFLKKSCLKSLYVLTISQINLFFNDLGHASFICYELACICFVSFRLWPIVTQINTNNICLWVFRSNCQPFYHFAFCNIFVEKRDNKYRLQFASDNKF